MVLTGNSMNTLTDIKSLQSRLRSAWREWNGLGKPGVFEKWMTNVYGVDYVVSPNGSTITSAWVENEKKYMLFLMKHEGSI